MKILSPLLVLTALSGTADAQSCPTRVLVSGFFSNNVHIYDGCTGAFQRLLDTNPERGVAGAQATRTGPAGTLWAVAEGRGAIQRYDGTTLDYIDTVITLPTGFGGTGMDFGPDGDVYIAGYNTDTVRRYDRSGVFKSELFARNPAILKGPDNGMVFGPDGRLYIPGYDSNTVAVVDEGGLRTLVAAGSGGIVASRGILFEPDGSHFLLSAERSNRILRINASSGAIASTLNGSIGSPTGMAYTVEGNLLVGASGNRVVELNSQTGATVRTLVTAGSGGLRGPTFITVLHDLTDTPTPLDQAQIGSQYWVVGNAPLTGKVLDIGNIVSATGTVFGEEFQAQDVVRKRWGRIRIEFTSCDRALLNWDSTGENSAGFGDGGYELTRLFDSSATQLCREQGFAQTSSAEWIQGSWYSEARSGEGILLDKRADGEVFLAWFTHRPSIAE